MLAKIFELKILYREKTRTESKKSLGETCQSKPEPVIVQAQTHSELLDEFAKAHAEHDLYFNRTFEQDQINILSIDQAREYLQSALDSRIERAQSKEQERGFEL